MNVQQYIDNIETIETDKLENFETTYDINKLRDIMQNIINEKEINYKHVVDYNNNNNNNNNNIKYNYNYGYYKNLYEEEKTQILSDEELINIVKGIYEERKRRLEGSLKNIKYNCVLNNSTNTYLTYDYDKKQLYKVTITPDYGSKVAIGMLSILFFWHPFCEPYDRDTPPAGIHSRQLVTDINVIKNFTKEYVNIINKTKIDYYDNFNKNVIKDIIDKIEEKVVSKNNKFTLSILDLKNPLRIRGGMGGVAFST
jgi:hypothetical protein